MPPRTLASLAHALGAAPDFDAALVALGEALADIDRSATVSIIRYEPRRDLLLERLTPGGDRVNRARVDTTLDHLPAPIRAEVIAGGRFAELAERSDEYARLLGLVLPQREESLLALRGVLFDGALNFVVSVLEPRRFFGTRVTERFAPAVALFEVVAARFAEREARDEAVRTLEDVTQRVHGEYVRRLAELERELERARANPASGSEQVAPERLIHLEQEVARAREEARRVNRRAEALDQQIGTAVGQLEYAHVELHRRSESLRQRTRTLYLLDLLLTLDSRTTDARQLADGLLSLVGDDTQAQRCSLMLVAPGTQELYIAAARGLSPEIGEGTRTPVGSGVAGKVAASREPLLVTDVSEAAVHPLLRDEYFTTGSFISFPLVYHGDLVGVVNLTNRAQRGVFVEEDVDRVRLLALVISLVAARAALPERLLEAMDVR